MENKIICGIYKITSSSGRVYIGQSINIIKRVGNYKCLSCEKQRRICNSVKKYGWEEHIFEIVEECNIEDLNCRERYWQDFYDVLGKGGLNCELTECGQQKKILSQESKDRISKNRKGKGKRFGKDNPMYGKPVSDETREKLSKSLKGRIVSEDTRNKISEANKGKEGLKGEKNPMFGKKVLESTVLKIVEKNKENYNNFTHGKGNIVLCLETGIFYTPREASKIYNINYSTLHSMLNGSRTNKTSLIFC